MSKLTIELSDSNKRIKINRDGKTSFINDHRDVLIRHLSEQRMRGGSGDQILPHGTRFIVQNGNIVTSVVEFAPKVWSFVKHDSERFDFAAIETNIYQLSLPYVLLISSIIKVGRNEEEQYYLSGATKCLFNTKPLRSIDDSFYKCVLPNCSDNFGNGKHWICMGSFHDEDFEQYVGNNHTKSPRYVSALIKVLSTSFEARAFNDEVHRDRSSYAAFGKNIKGIYPLRQWAKNSKKPDFWKKVLWIPCQGETIRSVIADSHRWSRRGYSAANLTFADDGGNDYLLAKKYIYSRGVKV